MVDQRKMAARLRGIREDLFEHLQSREARQNGRRFGAVKEVEIVEYGMSPGMQREDDTSEMIWQFACESYETYAGTAWPDS